MLRILTAGESHGKALIGIIEGLPSNLPIDLGKVNQDLKRRQSGYGRGGRMKIESDRIEVLSGMRGGKTLGSPLAFMIQNRDYENWQNHMHPTEENETTRKVTRPRPGHADLIGAQKYGFEDIRNVLERSSARETTVRVAAGSILKQLVECFQIQVYSHVVAIGPVSVPPEALKAEKFNQIEESPVRCICPQTSEKMIAAIDQAKTAGYSLGGIFQIQLIGAPQGLGTYVHWDRKLDAKLAYALIGIQGIKGVEFGNGFQNSQRPGNEIHDEIFYSEEQGYYRKTNHAGGIEGGMSNGEPIVIQCAMKPIPTQYSPLCTVDILTREGAEASVERSDTCAVPAAAVVGEMVAAAVVAETLLEKYSGDSFEEMIVRWKG